MILTAVIYHESQGSEPFGTFLGIFKDTEAAEAAAERHMNERHMKSAKSGFCTYHDHDVDIEPDDLTVDEEEQ